MPTSALELRLLHLLVENGALAADDLPRILELLRAESVPLGAAVARLGLLSPEEYPRRAAACLRMPFFDLRRSAPRPRALALLDRAACLRLGVLPVLAGARSAAVACAEPPDADRRAELARLLGRRLLVGLAAPDALDAALGAAYPEAPEVLVLDAVPEPDDLRVVAPVNAALLALVRHGATHLHLEPDADGLRLRLRLDGRLVDLDRGPASVRRAFVARLKILAGLDLAERRRPQEGVFAARWAGGSAAFRLSTAPLLGGEERAVVRRLAPADPVPTLEELGIDGLSAALARRRGLILFTGPDRTAALHAALAHLAADGRAVLAVAERPLDGLPCAAPAAVPSLPDQDADVVGVDGLDDPALLRPVSADRLVLAAVRTPGRADAIVEARRLRRLCAACRRPAPFPAGLGLRATVIFGPVGCAACLGTGYRGRLWIGVVRPGARPARGRRLLRAALDVLDAGLTSLSEVLELDADSGTST